MRATCPAHLILLGLIILIVLGEEYKLTLTELPNKNGCKNCSYVFSVKCEIPLFTLMPYMFRPLRAIFRGSVFVTRLVTTSCTCLSCPYYVVYRLKLKLDIICLK
jgi:hypothetical protein